MMTRAIRKTFVQASVVLLALLWVAPVLIVIINAAKSTKEFRQSKFWELPADWAIVDNIEQVLFRTDLGRGFVNSIVYGCLGAGFAIALAALAAFALTNLKIKGAFYWFLLIYSGTLFPFQMYLIPLFKMYSGINLYNSMLGLTLFYIGICIPFCLFVLRNYYMTFPKDYVNAAQLDGCSDFQTFLYLFVPQSLPPFFVLFLLQFTWIWNDLIFGLVLSRDEEVRPVMASLAQMTGMYSGTGMPTLLMGALIASLPTLLLFFGLQRSFMQGLAINVKD
ncbi:carbohydrate ABC transporter permease [Paenibacillus cisolokensis]|nr:MULTISPECIES: carbohydrate ABC transporter permease [Paenibacillus]